MIEDLKQLLDYYYGESCDEEAKEEIAEFIENYASDILSIFKDNDYQ